MTWPWKFAVGNSHFDFHDKNKRGLCAHIQTWCFSAVVGASDCWIIPVSRSGEPRHANGFYWGVVSSERITALPDCLASSEAAAPPETSGSSRRGRRPAGASRLAVCVVWTEWREINVPLFLDRMKESRKESGHSSTRFSPPSRRNVQKIHKSFIETRGRNIQTRIIQVKWL